MESIKGPESLEDTVALLMRELGLMNIKTTYEDDRVLPAIVAFWGRLDETETTNVSDDDIEYVISKMNRDFRGFDFAYDGQGAITVMPKVQ
jgi:hypothetical protein